MLFLPSTACRTRPRRTSQLTATRLFEAVARDRDTLGGSRKRILICILQQQEQRETRGLPCIMHRRSSNSIAVLAGLESRPAVYRLVKDSDMHIICTLCACGRLG